MVRITENTFNLIFTIFNTVHLFRSRFLSGIILLFVELPLILLVLAGLLAVISVNFCLMRNLFCIHFRSYFCVGIGFWVFLFLSALSEISFNCLLTCIVFCMKSWHAFFLPLKAFRNVLFLISSWQFNCDISKFDSFLSFSSSSLSSFVFFFSLSLHFLPLPPSFLLLFVFFSA